MQTCKLCQSEAELRDSHIIPELMYKPLYDAMHRAASVSIDGKAREAVLQKGLREKLLCQECETRFSKLERYAASVFRDILSRLHEARAGTEVVESAEYRPLKLFQLSLLWRAAVARHSNFRGADLAELEPTVRSMLLRDEPGPVTAFPCFAIAPLRVQDFKGTMGPTKRGVLNGVAVAHFLILGIQWYHLLTTDLGSLPSRMSVSVTHHGLTITVSDYTVEQSVRKIADEIYQREPGGA